MTIPARAGPRAWLAAVLLALFACGDRRGAVLDDAPPAVETEKPVSKTDAGPPRETGQVAGEEPRPQDPRQERLLREWERHADAVVEHSLADLPEDERRFVGKLIEAAGVVEELHLLQIHPSNVEWRDRIEREGTEVERRIFHRYQSPWCMVDPDPECNALVDLPAREYGRGLWPAGIGSAKVEAMARLINGRELLSPFTGIVRGDDGRLGAVPYAADPAFGPRMTRLAALMREAAARAPHSSMKRFLQLRADAFESSTPFPYDDSDYDWIRLQGEWEVTVGPYETYDCPHGTKALFQMLVGRINEDLTAAVRKLSDDLKGVDEALALLIGQEKYTGRRIGSGGTLRVVDVWIATGDARRERGATLAYHLPNRGRAAAEGLSGKVVLANHAPLFENAARELAGRMLVPAQAALADPAALLANVACHELAHGLGHDAEARIVDPQGKAVTLHSALRAHFALVEELKADALGMWLLAFARERGWVDDRHERSRWTAAVVHWLGLLQGPLADVHAQMAAVQLGWHLEAGSISWSVDDKKLEIDFGKMPAAANSLASEVLLIQLTGDHARARALMDRFLLVEPASDLIPRETLALVRTVAIERAASSSALTPCVRYIIHDAIDQ